jgi:hypothetical protein
MVTAQQLGRGAIKLRKAPVALVPVVKKSTNPIKATNAIMGKIANLRNEYQVQSTITRGESSIENLVAKDGSVKRNFVLNSENRINRNLATKQWAQQKASKDTTFYESWEAYDDSTENWMPANWTQLNRTGSKYVAGSPNMRWFCRDVGTSATDGSNIAWINFDESGKMRDEWIVTPVFTPVVSDYLAFDLYYTPFYMYFDMDAYNLDGTQQFDFSRPTTTMQVLVSLDNGENWTKIWDAHNYVNQYNDTTIYNYQNGAWNSFNMSLSSYAGKKIKVAFRYFGKGGDSMGLDNVGIRLLKPIAEYGRPQGYFFLGVTPEFNNASVDLMLGAPYLSNLWKNNSNHDSQSFVWTFEDQKKPNATFTSTDIWPSVVYPAGFFGVPQLKASVGGFDSYYKWGSSNNGAYFMSGGTNTFDWGTVGACNYDLAYGINAYTFDDNDYIFGTGPKKEIDGIANYFEKPKSKYLLDKLWISLGAFSAPKGFVFKLRIRKDDGTGGFNTIISTATCTTEDVIKVDDGYYTMPFKNFVTYDPDLDLMVTNDFLEINDALLFEMYGFNKDGITLGAYSQGLMRSGESNAYVYYNNYKAGKRQLYNIRDFTGYSSSLLFNLGASYTYLVPDDSVFVAPVTGGSKTFKVTTYAPPSDWWINEELPSWLTTSSTFDAATGATTYTLNAQSLPADVAGRGVRLKVYAIGASMTIDVSQGNYIFPPLDPNKIPTESTGFSSTKATTTRVLQNRESLELTYSSDFNRVDLYTVGGQKVASYPLSVSGIMTMPIGNISKGVYLLKFTGRASQTFKIVQK